MEKEEKHAVRLVRVGLITLRAAPSLQQQVSECSVTGGGGQQEEGSLSQLKSSLFVSSLEFMALNSTAVWRFTCFIQGFRFSAGLCQVRSYSFSHDGESEMENLSPAF